MLYRRPGTVVGHFLQKMEEILETLNGRKCILMGDINLNLLDVNNDSRVCDLISLFNQFSFEPVITKPTRVANHRATIIDQIWVNNVHRTCTSSHRSIFGTIIISDVSDHFPCCVSLNSHKLKHQIKNISYRDRGENCDRLFKNLLMNVSWEELLNVNDVNMSFSMFNDIVFRIYEEAYPLITKRCNSKFILNPWMTTGLKNSIDTKEKLYIKSLRRPISYGERYRRYRNLLHKLIKIAKDRFYAKRFLNANGDKKKSWKVINDILGKNNKSSNDLFVINSKLTTDRKAIANEFNEYYTSIADTVTQRLPHINRDFREYLPARNFNPIEWTLTTPNEIKNIISKLKKSSPGVDQIPIGIFKNNVDIFSFILSHLFNLSLTQGVFPVMHKKGRITPLFKSKNPQDVQNYRPICILNSINKILEKIVNNRLLKHLSDNQILNCNQFAYRKKSQHRNGCN